ncbi:phytoene/squalene synthetase [Balneicella halophila]|uniref:Phytoene/squalene synthetase n=1 Tax=Balneicella halophila TaxID=1537566 RepID=A0A7L4UN03_BALHA|nr:phytoene/squalene synthase family protein [Balneicella halophila]PVX49214.1 phytoene/squalene synthetase [Balneicella halophila]
MNVDFYIENSYHISKLITKKYSTSFSLATSLLEKEKKRAIYAVYGFVRLADEIVDSLDGFDKAFLLNKLNDDLNYALENDISTNTVLVAFADTVKKYKINHALIKSFMDSMEYDLSKTTYDSHADLDKYIYGSANVVGLMCLKIFCNGESCLYESLELPAQRLGSAFQKVNFLRDIKEDIQSLGRTYFPEITEGELNEENIKHIELSIKKDFDEAWVGIKQLPGRSKLAVALAYYYYNGLFKKILRTPPEKIMSKRIRISNIRKYLIILKTAFMYKAKLI